VRGLAFLASRWMLERKSRTLLTGAGIALGVALLFGTLITVATVTRSFDRFVDLSGGGADIVVSAVGASFALATPPVLSSEVAERIDALPGVEATAELVAFPTVVETEDGRRTDFLERVGRAAVTVVGVDLDMAPGAYEFQVQRGRLPSAEEGLVMSSKLAGELDVAEESTVFLSTPSGRQRVEVAGVLEDAGVGRLNDGNILFLPIELARSYAGIDPDRMSMLFVWIEGVEVGTWTAEAGAALGPEVNIQPLGSIWDLERQQITGISGIFTVAAAMALLVAGFLVYLTLSMSVTERVKLYGTLLALGTRPRQMHLLVLSEAVILGLVSTAIGLVFGFGLSYVLVETLGNDFAEFVTLDYHAPVWALLASIAFGLVVTCASSLAPGWKAARLDPSVSMRGDYAGRVKVSRGWTIGAAGIVAGLALAWEAPEVERLGWGAPGVERLALAMPLLLLGSLMLLPPLLKPLASVLGRLTRRLAAGVGEVAVHHLSRERTRSAYTLGLVMVVVAFSVGMATVRSSFWESVLGQADRFFGADFILTAASTFDEEFVGSLTGVSGVRFVTPEASVIGRIVGTGDEGQMRLTLVDPSGYPAIASLDWTSGEDASVWEALEAGGSVAISKATAEDLGLSVGDSLSLRTAQGPKEFVVAGVAAHPSAMPTAFLGLGDASLFGGRDPDHLHVLVERGTRVEDVMAAVEAELSGQSAFLMRDSSDFKAAFEAEMRAGFNGSFAVVGLMGVVGMFGLANTLAMSVLERRREIGILRAIGVRRRQLAGMTLVESTTLISVAFVIGVPIGLLISRFLVPFTARILGDLTVTYVFPWMVLPALAVSALAVGALASIAPARRATQIDIEEALRVE
jgi:putative ABC transport system permease protein